MRDTSSNESSSNKKEEEDDEKGFEERQAKTGINNLRLSVFHRDYLRTIRGTGSLLTKKRERYQICELENVV